MISVIFSYIQTFSLNQTLILIATRARSTCPLRIIATPAGRAIQLLGMLPLVKEFIFRRALVRGNYS